VWTWWKRRGRRKDVLEYLEGFGRMLQSIDARLEEIADLLRSEDDDG
jgi:hypothetical protein